MICPHCGNETQNSFKEINEIVKVVCNHFGISEYDMKKYSRKDTSKIPRYIAMYLSVFHTSLKLASIGSIFNKRDHTTVIHARDRVIIAIQNNEDFIDDLREIENKLELHPVHFYKPKKLLQIA